MSTPALADLQCLKLDGLRAAWRSHFACEPPAFRSRDLMLRAFVYQLESARFGGPKGAIKKRLTELEQRFATDAAYSPAPRIVPSVGSALVREWNGVRHVVLVTTDGFKYLDKTYPSLTQIAKTISGIHQSGPLFFGLTGRRATAEASP